MFIGDTVTLPDFRHDLCLGHIGDSTQGQIRDTSSGNRLSVPKVSLSVSPKCHSQCPVRGRHEVSRNSSPQPRTFQNGNNESSTFKSLL